MASEDKGSSGAAEGISQTGGILDLLGSIEKDLLTKKSELLSKYKGNPLDSYFSLKPPKSTGEESGGRFFVRDGSKTEGSDEPGDSELNDMFDEALKQLDDPDSVTVPETKIPDTEVKESKDDAADKEDGGKNNTN